MSYKSNATKKINDQSSSVILKSYQENIVFSQIRESVKKHERRQRAFKSFDTMKTRNMWGNSFNLILSLRLFKYNGCVRIWM